MDLGVVALLLLLFSGAWTDPMGDRGRCCAFPLGTKTAKGTDGDKEEEGSGTRTASSDGAGGIRIILARMDDGRRSSAGEVMATPPQAGGVFVQ